MELAMELPWSCNGAAMELQWRSSPHVSNGSDVSQDEDDDVYELLLVKPQGLDGAQHTTS
jgi:hypothetical protein